RAARGLGAGRSPRVVTREWLERRRQDIARSPDLHALLAHLKERAAPVLNRMPPLPEHKALLSRDGGVCPDDGTPLAFDPWSPEEHRCPRCGRMVRGERHDRHWARFQHLWLAERAAHLAALGALDGDRPAAARAREILAWYAGRYFRYPNRDNVLGPSRLFFSTYLESVWVLNYLAAAVLLREADLLDEPATRGVGQVADEAANLIGEYDEGFSNRQTWNNAALAAIAVWFEDEDLARTAIESRTGLVAHLRGFREDGLWYEGENYHLFALRGLVTGAVWARLAGVDLFTEPPLRERVVAALRAPALSALPDLTFPARKDSRFGVSLAQPMYLDTWEVGLGMLAGGEQGAVGVGELTGWLAALYGTAAPAPELLESYLHDAPFRPLPTPRSASRTTLSWWALLEMLPALPASAEPWVPASVLLSGQGLPVLRTAGRYVSVECGPLGGGHGHPDRLHLTLHAGGVHWLADPGTGSYVASDLAWYRSPYAHNAPIVDGKAAWRDAECERFEASGEWAWTRGAVGEVRRTVVSGPDYVLDVVELDSAEDHTLELPWHVRGRAEIVSSGRWEPADLPQEFVSAAERFVPDRPEQPLAIRAEADGGRLVVRFAFAGDLLRATAPGVPSERGSRPFFLVRALGRFVRIVTLLEPHTDAAAVRELRVAGDHIEVETAVGTDHHDVGSEQWSVRRGDEPIRLGGVVAMEPPFRPLLEFEAPRPAVGVAYRVGEVPALDGTLEGFDPSEPLGLDLEDQYRRAEEPYPGPEELSAAACAAWDDDALYLAVRVTKPEVCLRRAGAPPLLLDNEPDDIHSDGLQVYCAGNEGGETGDGSVGYLAVPEEDGGLRVRPTSGTSGDPRAVRGGWRRTDDGYCVTLALPWPAGFRAHFGARVGFDLLVNELPPGRVRRAGQLVWSGGNGWVWLRGDRQDPQRFGVLELVG
ncbi:MAG: heparinase II/III domain-containing protein, partial [Gemmatimonadales bacterium]